jgi:FK506-binding protein 2
MKGLLLTVSLLATAASTVLGAELGIEKTKEVECKRKTQNGDSIQVHYRGTLQSNGNEFDASESRPPYFEP